jgi:hypothetical protein
MKQATFFLGIVSTSLFACSGGSSDINDAAAEGSTDATIADASDDTMGAMDVATSDAADTGVGGSCGDAGARAMCERCCAQENAQGFEVFLSAALGCACTPALCGDIDGGPKDAGPFGNGDCAMTCTNPKTPPDNKCIVCLRDSEGKMGAGPCGKTIDMACSKSAPCVAYMACAKTCN